MIKRIFVFLISFGFLCNPYLSAKAMEETQKMTVASYLKLRLESLEVTRLFGVAGNYTAPFLDTILEDNKSPIKITGTSNELCAGYAADGYARIRGERGLGAIAVTYGVGAFSVLNAVAGSFVEQVPVVVINGAPTNKQFSTQQSVGLLYSHMMPNPTSNIDVYRSVTVAAERISNAEEAPLQIDSALTACITRKQPVYLEVLEDVWRARINVPKNLRPIGRAQLSVTKTDTDEAVEQTIKLISEYAHNDKSKPMFWAGVEIQRLGIQNTFVDLLKTSGFQYTTSVLGKSLISEDNEWFSSVGLPKNASCVIGLGAWTTGKDIGPKSIVGDRDKVLVSQGNAFVGGAFFPNVPLDDFMKKLQEKLNEGKATSKEGKSLLANEIWANPDYSIYEEELSLKHIMLNESLLNYDNFFYTLNEQWIKDSTDTTVVVDSSFPLIASQKGLRIKSPNGFVAQASWLSIGYAAPAAIGVKCAIDDHKLGNKRLVVVAGDGAFQETCQAVSSYVHLKQNTVVFVLANGIYGIEQKIVNPNPFRKPPIDESNKAVYEYNELCQWNYEKLTDVFGGGIGVTVDTVEGLVGVIKNLKTNDKVPAIVHVKIPKLSFPSVLKQSLKEAGEDEVRHPSWPSKDIF